MTIIDDHLETLRLSRYSDKTLDARARVLKTLPSLLNITRPQMQAWWASRQVTASGHERAATSLQQESSHIREFFRWCRREGLIEDHNPADWLPRARQKSTLSTSVPEADLFRIIAGAPSPMRQMVALAAMAGLRSAEIAVIQWSDIDNANGVLWVREGKGDKDRSVPLSTGLLAELGTPDDGPIAGKTMTGKAVSMAIGRYMRSEDCDYSAHKLRSRFATRFMAATGDLAATATVMGHSDVRTTARYVTASSDTMRRGSEACGRIG